ncbi:peptidase M24, structural domain-containing protein [Pyrenochaeta sp. MPI-SDFR-AT-0127]|nr:peptidase M24, structural domain-containing protein [Pyrenochaeta sp. MPI-SDFR-AT-0127]
MATFDWHAERSDLSNVGLLDQAPESIGIDLKAVRMYRLERVRGQMAKFNIDAMIIGDPVSIRYATGSRNMQICTSRNQASRYLVLTANRSILFEFVGCAHLADGLDTVDEVRIAKTAAHIAAGPKIEAREKEWVSEMGDLITELCGEKATLGLERMNANVAIGLKEYGLTIVDAQKPLEIARSVKSPEEIKCVLASLRATERAVGKLRDAIRPGLTENELWAVLHKSIIEQNGDYCETRLLTAGPRTNPWFQETASYTIRENELIALDTDVVGCHGYYCDFSRTFHSGPDAPTKEQQELYRVAYEQVAHNISILRPGMTFREYADAVYDIPKKYWANRYFVSAHGCGMACEYPYLYHRGDFPEVGYDGVIEPGMVLCVEAFVGEEGGKEGVKLEQQVLITENGVEILSQFPFESSLLGIISRWD